MFVSDCLEVNQKGHLSIGGCDTLELAAKYDTPLYVMDEATIRESCRLFQKSFERYYSGNGLVLFASKAFCCKEIYRIIGSEGLGADVVSGGEIYTALKAGFPAKKMYFHGNNKTAEEICFALDNGVGYFVVDNREELAMLDRLAGEKQKVADILLRIKPGIDAHTHEWIKTGQIDSKFGFTIENEDAEHAVQQAMECRHVTLKGIHCHIGSQIFDIGPFELAAEVMLAFMARMKQQFGVDMEQLNLGGGFGIKYIPSHNPVSYDRYMELVAQTVRSCCKKYAIRQPEILIEPGRSIVGAAGITLYTVGSVKEIPGMRTYVSVDGGMADNPRYSLYQAPYDAVIADRAGDKRNHVVTIAGRCCETDLLQENIALQEPKEGDILAMFATGAYNYSMASNYNRLPRPAVVMITDGQPRVVVRRESYEDLLRLDV